MDAPELAHFGNPAQPHGKESLEWLTKTVLGKRLRVQVLRRDQYGRIVSDGHAASAILALLRLTSRSAFLISRAGFYPINLFLS